MEAVIRTVWIFLKQGIDELLEIWAIETSSLVPSSSGAGKAGCLENASAG